MTDMSLWLGDWLGGEPAGRGAGGEGRMGRTDEARGLLAGL